MTDLELISFVAVVWTATIADTNMPATVWGLRLMLWTSSARAHKHE